MAPKSPIIPVNIMIIFSCDDGDDYNVNSHKNKVFNGVPGAIYSPENETACKRLIQQLIVFLQMCRFYTVETISSYVISSTLLTFHSFLLALAVALRFPLAPPLE